MGNCVADVVLLQPDLLVIITVNLLHFGSG
jgi:hypothetical protein